jgi:ribonuclease BN (tRNA processing enzyme)
VVISHLHADHVLDLVPYASALAYSPRGAAGQLARPPLHVPPHGADHLAAITVAGGMRAEHVERPFALREYDPAETLTVGDLGVRFQPVPHYIPSNAVELTDGQVRFTFGGDCGPSTALAEFARETDLLMVEATLPEPDADPRGHLTAYEAGEHGRRAAARRVVVTHWSDELDPEVIRAEAERGFGGAVELAADGAVYEVKVHRPAADAVK